MSTKLGRVAERGKLSTEVEELRRGEKGQHSWEELRSIEKSVYIIGKSTEWRKVLT